MSSADALTWCDRTGHTHKVMTARDSAVLCGFPADWLLPSKSRDAQTAVGNCICVEMSQAICQAALALKTGTLVSANPGQPDQSNTTRDSPPKRNRDDAEDVTPPAKRLKAIDRRLKSIEHLLLHGRPEPC